MQEIRYPFFKKDRILKISMLENLRDYPRDVLEAYHLNSSDGIVCGFTASVLKDSITFSKGITKYKDNLYVLPKAIEIQYSSTDEYVMIKLCFCEEANENDFKTMYAEIKIDEDIKITETEQELGRFKLKKGAYLRSDYKDLNDFTTEYNTINIVSVLYSAYENPTISIELLKYFAKEAMQYRTQNPIDIPFCLLCLNSEKMERAAVCTYISYRTEEELINMSNQEIHAKLVRILDIIRKESSFVKRKRLSSNKIIVD